MSQKQGKAVVLFNRFTVICFLFMCACVCTRPSVAAEALSELPKLSQNFDVNAFAAKTDTLHKDNTDIPSLSYEIALPKTWVERATLGQDFGEMVRYDGPAYGDERPYFSIKRMQLKRENSAKLELMAYMLEQGYVLRALKEIDDRNIEALYVAVDSGISYAVRMRGRIFGPEFVLAEYAVPVSAWGAMRDEQIFAMGSFKFLHNSDAPIEKRIERTYFRSVRFYYPASWRFVDEQVPADNKMSVHFVNQLDQGLESGTFRLSVLSSASLKDEDGRTIYPVDVPAMLKEVRARYEGQGFALGARLPSQAPKLNLPTVFSSYDVYQLIRRQSIYDDGIEKGKPTHELLLAVFAVDKPVRKVYVAEMLTPAREQDLYAWSVNTRAFNLIVRSIQ